MKDTSSSRLALKHLLKQKTLPENEKTSGPKPTEVKTPEKRHEQRDAGKFILDFLEKKSSPVQITREIAPTKRKQSRGRPKKNEAEKARNITLCLSQEQILFLDELDLGTGKDFGRGRKVNAILESFALYQQREIAQVKFLQNVLAIVDKNLNSLSGTYKRADNFFKNEQSLTALEKSIGQVRIILNLLQVDKKDLKRLLSPQEFSTYEFCLSWLTNRKRAQ